MALAILSLIGVDIVLAVISSIIIAMIMTSTGLPEMGTMLAKSTGSFIATVGLIIMLGAGVGEVATRTGAAVELVKFVVHRIGLSSQTRGEIRHCGVIDFNLRFAGHYGRWQCHYRGSNHSGGGSGTLDAANGRRADDDRRFVGLFTGPFTPSTVTILSLGGLSYPDYLLYVGLPMSAVHAAGRLGNGGTDPEDDRRQTAL
ncbi:citrate transporter family protein [Klebsiella pneumoniae]|uniref:Citrate transporter family protein n=1 Tax=Klebsiella pneumoniae TaxID=573 RepID=A0A377V865_KLEPN|nr:citrate transporter family protein [Klebsiella pneumoniae]